MPILIQCDWDSVPHLGEKEKADLLASYPPHQRDARTKGVPMLGAGAVYPKMEEEILCDPFPIPPYWPRAYGLDVGWSRTATVWGALDRNTDCLFIYAEHYQGRLTPQEHARAIKMRGSWIPGVIDPASAGSSQHDGQRIIDLYRKEGLDLTYANNDVEAGIYAVWQRLENNRLKIFKSLVNLRQEYRLYRRDPKGSGKVVKPRLPLELPEGKSAAEYGDHCLDALRYLVFSAMDLLKPEPPAPRPGDRESGEWRPKGGELAWMS
jgi:hypothetical protein